MQVSVEKTSELTRKLTVEIPQETYQADYDKRLKTLSRQVKLDGFRPGKAPMNMVEKRYGDQLRQEVVSELLQTSYTQALQDNELVPAGKPVIKFADDSFQNGFNYTAEIELYPEVDLTGLSALTVKKPVATVDEAVIDRTIEQIRAQHKTWQAAERAAQAGDRLTVNLTGTSGDNNFTQGTIEGFAVEIGSQRMIPGFEDALIGLSAGEQKTFSLPFPDDYHQADLAGQQADFQVDVVAVEQSALPDVDADFVKKMGVEDGSVDGFRSEVKANLDTNLNSRLQQLLRQNLFTALQESIDLTVPKVLVDEEIANQRKSYAQQAEQRKVDVNALLPENDALEALARNRAKLSLIVGEVVTQQQLTVKQEKVRAIIEGLASQYEQSEQVINWYYSDEKRLQDIQARALEDEVIEWLLTQVHLEDESMSFDQVMGVAEA
ncbi:MAG: trigger factor [Methylococcales bacterium]|nr:trigger factor [Methylococcales bacterium]